MKAGKSGQLREYYLLAKISGRKLSRDPDHFPSHYADPKCNGRATTRKLYAGYC